MSQVNLSMIEKQLDCALGDLDNAMQNLHDLNYVGNESIKDLVNSIDFQRIVALRNELLELIGE